MDPQRYLVNVHSVYRFPLFAELISFRRTLSRGLSIQYLVPDVVIEYIYKHNLYDSKTAREARQKALAASE